MLLHLALDAPMRDNTRADASRGEAEILERLTARLGSEIVPAARIWRELGFPSAGAARKARARGIFPIELFRLKGRRGYFTTAQAIAHWLARVQRDPPE